MTELADRVAASLKSSSLVGAVASTSAGGVRQSAAAGVRKAGQPEAMTVETPVLIASVTKPVVAAAVVLAARELPGLLDRPVIEYLPELLADWQVSRELTLRALLSQTSGLGQEIDREALEALGEGDDALLGAARLVVGQRQVAPIGTTWSYENENYCLAGAALARVRGTTFEVALDELVLKPAAMTATGFETPVDAAHGHLDGEPVARGFLRALRPAGGLWSTASDLMSFAEFVLADAELLAAMRAPVTDPSMDRQYGLGWFLGDQVIFHPGGARGFESLLVLAPESRYATALVVNQDTSESWPSPFADVIGAERTEAGGLRLRWPPI